jgi:HKD family nuclease
VLPNARWNANRGGSLRVLTGDYLDVTEPAALRLVADLEGARKVYIFRANAIPFHPKAWMFGLPATRYE